MTDIRAKLTGMTTADRKKKEEEKNNKPEDIAGLISTEWSPEITRIILPTGMQKDVAAKELMRQYKEEEQEIEIIREFEGWNYKDAFVALKKVSEKAFGWVNAQTVRTFFGKIYPKEIQVIVDIQNGVKITETCFYGKYLISAWEDAEVNTSISGSGTAIVKIVLKKRYSTQAKEFLDEAEAHLQRYSIYRGKSVVIGLTENNYPEFEIIENIPNDKIILNEEEESVIKTFVLGSLAEPSKRCYLFPGDYGTLKSLFVF